MRHSKTSAFVSALLSATALTIVGAQAQQVANTTPANVNVLNLLSPFLNLNATTIGQQTLQLNLSQAIAVNNAASPTQQSQAISDKSIFSAATNAALTASIGLTGPYGVAANLAGGLPAQTAVSGTNGSIIPQQPVGGLGVQLGSIYQMGVANGTAGPISGTVNLLVNAYNFTSSDLGVAKNYFADGSASNTAPGSKNSASSAAAASPAVAPAGYTLPTANGLPNITNSVYDSAYGVTNTQATAPGAQPQDIFGDSRPVQVTPTGINQFDSTSIVGLTTNPSFPSGHTNYAFTDSVLLAMLVPQDYQNMLLRAADYGNSRIALGVHYPLDIIASRAFSAYDLAQAFTNPLYINNGSTTGSLNTVTNTVTPVPINLPSLFTTANTDSVASTSLQTYLATNCGASVATCSTSAANTANDPYVPSAANAAIYAARLTYGLPTLTLAQAPQEAAPAGGPDASILLATVYGGDTTAAKTIAPNGGLDGTLSTATINQIIVNTENNALAAFYGTSLSYWTRINLYAASGYLSNVTGTLSLAPTDVVTQNVGIASGGTLYANGTVTGTTTVSSGGTLGGTGTVGATTIAAGGTLAPGGQAAIGTTNVAGNLAFASGANYNIRVTPTTNDTTFVTGTANLAGTVNVAVAPGAYQPNTNYTILTTTGGPGTINGNFTSVNTNLAFISGYTTIVGDPTVVLTLRALPFNAVAQTRNQNNVGAGLTLVNQAPLTAAGANIIGNLQTITTAAQGRATLDSLSGEGITAAQNAAHRQVEEFTSSIFDQTTFYGGGGAANSITLTNAPIRELADLPTRAVLPVPPIVPQRTWRAWATGFGGVESLHGNAGLGSAGQNDTIYGGTLGVDYQIAPNYLAGIAIGGSDGTFNVSGRATSGSTTGGHIAFYDLATFGAFYGASSNSVSFFNNKTTRNVAGFGTIAGETDRGNFDSHEFRTRLEFGRHFADFGGVLTPFIALELAELRSNGFNETNLGGPTVLGLAVQGQDTASVPSFVGARYQGVTNLGNGMILSPSLQLAYVHEFAPERSQIGAIASLPASTFLVDGARPARNAAQAKAGAELAIGPQSTLFATFDSEISGQAQFYGGKGGFRYVW